jgi:hypothetical protein
MATSNNSVLVGAATVTIGGWVSAAATTSMTDFGHTKAPVTIGAEFENFEAMSERSFGPVKIKPIGQKFTVQVPAMEVTAANMAVAYRQATGNLSGSAPNQTLLVDDATERYHQIIVTGPSPGTNGVGTYTFHKCHITSIAPNPIAKGDTQVLDMTFTVLKDDSVTAANKYFKYIET